MASLSLSRCVQPSRCGIDAYEYAEHEVLVEETSMSSAFNDEHRRSSEGWHPPRHEALQHLAAHTPIQIPGRCADASAAALFNPGRWLPSGALPFGAQPPPHFFLNHLPTSAQPQSLSFLQEDVSKKITEWHAANNNTTLGQQIWEAEKLKEEERRREAASHVVVQHANFSIETKPLPPVEQQSSSPSPEHPKSQDDPSSHASHTSTDSDADNVHLDIVDDEPEQEQKPSTARPTSVVCCQEQPIALPARPASCSPKLNLPPPTVDSNANIQPPSDDVATALLLNFSRQAIVRSEPEVITTVPNKFQCQLCTFSCASKFHFNSHMNTHGDHQCQMCDYTSRTEGRLKKHMRESHSAEERAAKGIELELPGPHQQQQPSAAALPNLAATLSQSLGISSNSSANPAPSDDAQQLQTTMASLLDAVNLAVSGASTLNLENVLANLAGQKTEPDDEPDEDKAQNALEQMRAFTESANLLPETPNSTLANALGAMTQCLNLSSPEKIEAKPDGSHPASRRSGSKQKLYKCKQCPHISVAKDEHWRHARTHIPSDKQLNCPQCLFVTEYKHHLEYHIRNHLGSKPFRCEKCAYMCVNKSMLNSHMKSHNNVYQFRCLDCTYATKYCHSLKQHLKKYNHRKKSDEGENPPISQAISNSDSAFQRLSDLSSFGIDVKPLLTPATTLAQSLGISLPPMPQPQMSNYPTGNTPLNILLRQQLDLNSLLPQLPLPPIPQLPLHQLSQTQNLKCAMCPFTTPDQEELFTHHLNHLNFNLLASVSQATSLPSLLTGFPLPPLPPIQPPSAISVDSGIDVVKTEETEELTPEHCRVSSAGCSAGCSSSPTASSGDDERDEEGKRHRKIRKIDEISARLSQGKSPSSNASTCPADNNNEDEPLVAEPSSSPSDGQAEVTHPSPVLAHPLPTHANGEGPLNVFQQAYLAHINAEASAAASLDAGTPPFRFMCQHCRMAFQDQALFHIHMGYHGYDNVFTCNRCGHTAHDPLNFNLHLLHASHHL